MKGIEGWARISIVLCLFGFLKSFKASEAFLTQYLISPQWVNITLTEAYQDVYPIWTYSYLAVLVFVFLLTDLVKYKPMIIFEGFAYIATWLFLVFGSGVRLMQLMQFSYGIATSTEVAYYAYIYAKVDSEKYQKVTSFTRVAILLGIFTSSVVGQLCVTYDWLDYRQLNILSLISVTMATLVSLLLPKVESSIYFHTNNHRQENSGTDSNNLDIPLQNTNDCETSSSCEQKNSFSTYEFLTEAFKRVEINFCGAFTQGPVLLWSLWWALGMSANYQVGNFIQPLWADIQQNKTENADQQELWNGAVEATSTLAGAILAFSFAFFKANWSLVGEMLLVLISLFDGIILIGMGLLEDIWIAYLGYILYRSFFQMLITIASFEIARQIKPDSCGLVFGVNTFMALALQSLLTLVVVELLMIPPKTQFVIYGGYCIFIALLLLVLFLVRESHRGWGNYFQRLSEQGFWQSDKPGKEDDVECRQSSLAGAIEATK